MESSNIASIMGILQVLILQEVLLKQIMELVLKYDIVPTLAVFQVETVWEA